VATIKPGVSGLRHGASPREVAEIGPWINAWRAREREGRGVLDTLTKNFAIAKRITIPRSLSFETAKALADVAGGAHPSNLRKLTAFLRQLGENGIAIPGSHKARRAIYRAGAEDLACLDALMNWWVQQEPRILADTALREVPVAELHTKWIEDNRGLCLSVFQDIGWADPEGTLSERLRLAPSDRGEVWARLHIEQVGTNGQRHLNGYAPSEFTEAPQGVQRVLIVENRTTFDRTAITPGTCLIYGSGKAILSYAPKMSWLAGMPEIVYWGDCDGAGYFILSRLRRALPRTRSILMDLPAIDRYRAHITAETSREAVRGPLPELTPQEAEARDWMNQGGLRLEQEYVKPGLDEQTLCLCAIP